MNTLGDRTWKTRDGKTLRWRDMEARHLVNTAAHLRRRAKSLSECLVVSVPDSFGGEDYEFDHTTQKSIWRMERIAKEMEAYAAHREKAHA